MSNDYLMLKGGNQHWLEDNSTENLLYSVIDFYKWSFIDQLGAYQNITRSPAVSGVHGGDRFRLSYTNEPRFTQGQVWQGFRGDWVWETGIAFSPPPTSVTVHLNGSLQPGTGYYVDYPRGRVIFNVPVATGSTVEASFSHRTVGFVPVETPWFKELMFESYNVQRNDFLNATAGGKWNQLGETRIQLPVVGVEVAGTRGFRPYQLGGGQWEHKIVKYYIYAESSAERDSIKDIIANQNDKVIWLYDRKKLKDHAMWPFTLDYRGAPISGFWTYPTIVAEYNDFRYLNAKFHDTTAENLDTKNGWLYGAVVSTYAEMITPYG
jgi:hypothetical protein